MEATRSDVGLALSSPSRTAQTPVRSPLVSPSSPSPASRRILVVVTIDAERYTPVDLTDVLDEGVVIRTRILNKLGIWDVEDQARSLIFETEIGALAIGQPLNDQSLSALCLERGDSRASLAFIVQRPPPRPTNIPSPQYQMDASKGQRQRNRSQTVNEQPPPAIPTSNRHSPDGLRSPPHRIPRPTDIFIEGANLYEPQPRRVRPLPAIPTPTSAPTSGNMVGSDPYAKIQALANEFDDLYDYAGGEARIKKPPRARRFNFDADYQPSKSLKAPVLFVFGRYKSVRDECARNYNSSSSVQ
ncbi:hypothetical protein D9615_007766 [Tricholomella constricta]|uniref:Uncharacterized protein n=1 Tax=Tricholomella constricta TaxID=117010 RepID=A0A8H5H3M3_9AGAR|nr:hypothetical protein D9615_007766 [Tricholomella constricta]